MIMLPDMDEIELMSIDELQDLKCNLENITYEIDNLIDEIDLVIDNKKGANQ